MEKTLSTLTASTHAWPFHKPVKEEDVADYFDIITQPMGKFMPLVRKALLTSALDFETMQRKLESNQYKNIEQFVDDALLVFDNCRTYNPPNTVYHRKADKMERLLKELLPSHVRRD
jgi:histone acetyltransferase